MEIANNSTPTHPPPMVGRLSSMRAITRELSKVYRDTREGRLPAGVATKLAFVLMCIGKTIEVELLEGRLEQLEEKAGITKNRSGNLLKKDCYGKS